MEFILTINVNNDNYIDTPILENQKTPNPSEEKCTDVFHGKLIEFSDIPTLVLYPDLEALSKNKNTVVRYVPNNSLNKTENNTLYRLFMIRCKLYKIVQAYDKNAEKGWIIPLDSTKGSPDPYRGGRLDIDSLKGIPEFHNEQFSSDSDEIESGMATTPFKQQTCSKIMNGSEERTEASPTSEDVKPLMKRGHFVLKKELDSD
jgi:hypothetical protein